MARQSDDGAGRGAVGVYERPSVWRRPGVWAAVALVVTAAGVVIAWAM